MLELPPLPPGFEGLDPHKRVVVYFRHLPHWRQAGATYFVTFRLSDSLPSEKMIELKNLRAHWEHTHPEPRSENDWKVHIREVFRRSEAWLDEGHGACFFREQRWGSHLQERLQHFNGERYQLSCSVIMPNHCHAIIRPFDGHELEDLLGTIKGVTARRINAATGGQGDLWQQESYDRIIRDAQHLYRVIQYIGNNPKSSGLPKKKWHLWIDPTWEKAGWGFQS